MTIALIVVSVLVTLGSNFGEAESAVTQALSIAPFDVDGQMIRWLGLAAVSSGEYGASLTPMFLHFGMIASGVQRDDDALAGRPGRGVAGDAHLLLLVVVLAAASNVCEYYLQWNINKSPPLSLSESPALGGLSGVL